MQPGTVTAKTLAFVAGARAQGEIRCMRILAALGTVFVMGVSALERARIRASRWQLTSSRESLVRPRTPSPSRKTSSAH
jgi:hypothetical protein